MLTCEDMKCPRGTCELTLPKRRAPAAAPAPAAPKERTANDTSLSLQRVGADPAWEYSHSTIDWGKKVGEGANGWVFEVTRGGHMFASAFVTCDTGTAAG